ncbi:hypothetical protein [Paraburkholderia hospita]|jgi:hypothetical protein|uniref:hypothetical protein n=1 Tax=Paraburkholderia hospita TaxID=169430 RepID=UPI0013FE3382|nr:hypothetical protein [Paraburkholderia hospita]
MEAGQRKPVQARSDTGIHLHEAVSVTLAFFVRPLWHSVLRFASERRRPVDGLDYIPVIQSVKKTIQIRSLIRP